MTTIIRFGDFALDFDQKSLSGPDGPIMLRPQSFAVLCHLLKQAPAVVSRNDLLDAVWGHQATSDSSVSQTIKELRVALGDSSSKPRFIATRRRLGYQFIAEINAGDASATRNTAHESRQARAQTPRIKVPNPLFAAGLVIVLFAAWWASNNFAPPDTDRQTNRQPTITVAIADFDDQGEAINSNADDWLPPAMKLFLGHSLSQLTGVNVTASSIDSEIVQGAVDYQIEPSFNLLADGGIEVVATIQKPDQYEPLTRVAVEHDRIDVGLISTELAGAISDWLDIESLPEITPAAVRSLLPPEVDLQRTFFQAQALLNRHEAVAAIKAIPDMQINDPFLIQLQSEALAQQGNILEARTRITAALQATELWPRRNRLAIEATAARLDFDFELAADRLQALNQFFPEPANIRRMIHAQIESDRIETAGEALQLLDRQMPNDPRIGLLQAELAGAENQVEQQLDIARNAYRQALEAVLPVVAAEALALEADALRKLGRVDEALATVERISDIPATDDLVPARAQLKVIQASLLFQQGDLEQALTIADQAQDLFTQVNSQPGLAETAIVRGMALERSGRLDSSLEQLNIAIEMLTGLGDQRNLARAHVNLGITLMSNGRPDEALANLGQAALFYREIGDRQGEAVALINRGTLFARQGRSDQAERALERALEAFVDIEDLRGQAITLGNLAALASRRGATERAIELNTEALELFRQLEAEIDAARTAYNLALVHRRLGNLNLAEQMILDAGQRFASQGSTMFEARAYVTQGAIMLDMGRNEESAELLERLDALAIENPIRAAEIETLRGELAYAKQDFQAAETYFQRAFQLRESAPDWQLVSELDLARVQLALDNRVQAEQEARRLADVFGAENNVYSQIDALLLQADSLIEQGRTSEAEELLQWIGQLLDASPHALKNLNMALLRARVSEPELAEQQLLWIIQTAAEQGFEPMLELANQNMAALNTDSAD